MSWRRSRRPGPRPVEIVVLAEPHPAGSPDRPDLEAAPAPDSSSGQLEPVLERKVDLDSLPVIRSHVIDGHAVLPMALILEWLAEGALHRHPGMVVLGIDNLRLFKGVVLRGAQAGDRFASVSAKPERGDGSFDRSGRDAGSPRQRPGGHSCPR